MNEFKFIHVSLIRTTPATLWRALTEPEFTQQYWHRVLRSNWTVGAPIEHQLADDSVEMGTVLEYDPPRRMSYRFDCDDEDLRNTKATMILEQEGELVKLTVIHEDLSKAGHEAVSSGWPGVLKRLKLLLETGSVTAPG
jgi:uncharacterized protein YndB with AHSA1/START domain